MNYKDVFILFIWKTERKTIQDSQALREHTDKLVHFPKIQMTVAGLCQSWCLGMKTKDATCVLGVQLL